MPRRLRKESSTGIYHIMTRGNNKEWVFKGDRFKSLYKERMDKVIESSEIELYAWCLMDNHVHIILKGEKDEISKGLKAINSYYAQRYNCFNKRVGHALQDRYKSEAVETDGYFKGVIRYVHQNPLKAKMVKNIADYEWSSYNEYLNGMAANNTINILEAYFNNDIREFIDYHSQTDYTEYLDLKDTIMKRRIEIAGNIIQRYCDTYQMKTGLEIHQNKIIRDKMIVEIKKKSNLQLTKISQMCGMSYTTIYDIINKEKDQSH